MMSFTCSPKCSKCGCEYVSQKWDGGRGNGEIIWVTCNKCGYVWPMRPKDYAKPTSGADSLPGGEK